VQGAARRQRCAPGNGTDLADYRRVSHGSSPGQPVPPMRVSIVINNFNYEQFVGQAIASALAQNHADVEVIVVDDGSTDGSVDEIRRYGEHLTLIEQKNGGQGAAYNTGLQHASGDVIIFLDADDWLDPQAAAQVAAAWRPGVSKVQFALAVVDREGQPLGRQVPRHLHDSDALELLREFGAYGSPPGSGNAYCAQFLRQVMPMDPALWRTAADSVPILLAPAYGELVSLPHSLGAYRLHRKAGAESLLGNNAPSGLWHEYDRIEWTKRFVERSLLLRGLWPRVPQLLAPWEARLVALCVRFGGVSAGHPSGRASLQLMGYALRSVWHWPLSGLRMKSMLSVWMMGVWLLPRPWAQRLARLHKSSMGAPIAG
jgi:glycosyltransferase involved in cell wall biosynthesis